MKLKLLSILIGVMLIAGCRSGGGGGAGGTSSGGSSGLSSGGTSFVAGGPIGGGDTGGTGSDAGFSEAGLSGSGIDIDIEGGSTPAVVNPEPSTLALLGIGLSAFVAARLKRRKK